MTKAQIIGVYPILEAPEPCHLIEMYIKSCEGPFDVGDITQADSSQPRDNWQVSHDERIISADGSKVLTEPFEAEGKPELWVGEFRLGFFFHDINLDLPLSTPFGDLNLPDEQPLPERLSDIEYEPPG